MKRMVRMGMVTMLRLLGTLTEEGLVAATVVAMATQSNNGTDNDVAITEIQRRTNG